MSGFRDLIHEAHRRSIWQVLGIYVVGSWVSLQVVDLLVDSFGLPEWLPPFALALLVLGLPVVLATAFVQEGVAPGPAGSDHVAGSTASTEPMHSGDSSAAPAVGAASAGTHPHTLQRVLTWRNAVSGGVLAFALWGVIATAVMLSGSGGEIASTSGEGDALALRSIAVLPFDNLSPDPDNAYFADGIHEDVLTQLSKIGDLTVISRTSVMGYRDTEKAMAVIGEELGVGSILEGSVRRAGDEVRITAQLIDARTDKHLWADNFDRQLSAASLFSIQSEIAERIADALAATLTPVAERQLSRTPTENLAAYDFYLQGRTMYALYTDAANDEGIRLFREAISRDPSYAEPWAGLADAYAQRVNRYGYSIAWGDSAEATATRALALDPELPAAHKALGNAYSVQERIQLALQANLKAVELDPNYAGAVNNVGVQYSSLGQFDEALRFYRRSYRLQPTTGFTTTNIGGSLALLGFLERAEERGLDLLRLQADNEDAVGVLRAVDRARGDYRKSLERSLALAQSAPDVARHQVDVAQDAALAGEVDMVIRFAREGLRLSPEGELWGGLHGVRTLLGVALLPRDPTEARALLEAVRADMAQRIESGSDASWVPMELAAVQAALGDTEAALEWAEQAYDLGFKWYVGLAADPAFGAIQDDPRWLELLSRMERDVAEQRANVERWEAEGSIR